MATYRIEVPAFARVHVSEEHLLERIRGLAAARATSWTMSIEEGDKATPAPIVPDADGDYKCPDCQRMFASGKALGGHRSKAHRPVTP